MGARVKKQDKAILENLPVESIKWIKQPFNLTFVKGEMSLVQVNIFVTLVESLQQRINDILNNRRSDNQLLLFDDSEFDKYGKVKVSIPLKSIVGTPHYKDAAIAAGKLFSVVENVTYTDSEGGLHVKLAHLFESVDIPIDERGRKKGEIVFEINKSMIESVFSLERYTKYIKGIATNFKSAYTGRMYMYIEAYRDIGHWTVKYEDLREMLGCKEWDDKHNRWEEKKFQKYRIFKDKVLDVAEKELRQLAENNRVDCYFEYKANKKPGLSLLEDGPESITFNIFVTKYGQDQALLQRSNSHLHMIESILRNDLGLKTTAVVQILKLANEENAEYLLRKLTEIKPRILASTDISSVKGYIITSFRAALEKKKQEEEEGTVDSSIDTPALSPSDSEENVSSMVSDIEEIEIIQNECTDAVKWFWETKWRFAKKDSSYFEGLNALIEGIDTGINKLLPSFNKANLMTYLKDFYAISKDFPNPGTIISFIKEQEQNSSITTNVLAVSEEDKTSKDLMNKISWDFNTEYYTYFSDQASCKIENDVVYLTDIDKMKNAELNDSYKRRLKDVVYKFCGREMKIFYHNTTIQ